MASISRLYEKYIAACKSLWYYGCETDSWLPEMVLIPYLTLNWEIAPFWLRIIGPSGCGKSDHITMLVEHDLAVLVDKMTSKSLFSGWSGPEGRGSSSTAPLLNGKVMVTSDESTFMELRADERNEIMSQLRKIYDGRYDVTFGQGGAGMDTYIARFNIVCGATPLIDRYFHYTQSLGERFINFRLIIPDPDAVVKRAEENMFNSFKRRYLRVRKKAHRLVNAVLAEKREARPPGEEVRDRIRRTASLIATLRTPVQRDGTGRHITAIPQVEVAGRLVQQISQVAVGTHLLDGSEEVRQKHLDKAVYTGMCSVPSITTYLLYYFCLYRDKWLAGRQVQHWSRLGRVTVSRTLEDLSLRHVLDQQESVGSLGGVEYRINREKLTEIDSLGLFKYYRVPKSPPSEEVKQRRGGHRKKQKAGKKPKKQG